MSKDERYVAIYARLSKEDNYAGRMSNSIAHQFEILHDYVDTHNLGRVLEYQDDGFSGTNFDRPDFTTMLRDIQRGLIGTVIVKDLSRFGREYLESGEYIEKIFPKFNVRFIAIMDGVDSDVPATMERIAYRNIDNENYARDVSKKLRIVMESKGNRGKRLTTRAIYGYKKNPDDSSEWLIDEAVCPIVQMIFKMYAEGTSITKIARHLESERILKPSAYAGSGSRSAEETEDGMYIWSPQTIISMLGKREYCGDTVNFRTTKKSFKSKEIIYNGEDKIKIFPDTHQAIISRELFELVQERLKKRKRMERIEDTPLFASMIFCADCQCRMHLMRTRKNKTDSYVCSSYRKSSKNSRTCTSHYVRVDVLSREVLNQIQLVQIDYLKDKEAFRQKVIERMQMEELIERESIDSMIEDTTRYLERERMFFKHTFENVIKELLPKEALTDLGRQYADRIEILEQKLEKLHRKKSEESEIMKNVERFFKALESHKRIGSLTTDLIFDLIDRIEVHEGKKIAGSRSKYSKVDIYYIGVGKIID